MPKRVIDGEAVWASDKIAACVHELPASTGVYYPWFYPLADVNGSFECTSTRVIHGRIALQLPFLTLAHTELVLHDFHQNGLLFVWVKEGKRWAHWTKSEEKSSVPKSQRDRYRPTAPPVPQKEYAAYLENPHSQSPVFMRVSATIAIHSVNPDAVLSESRVNPDAVLSPPAKLLLGLGLGVGIGASENQDRSHVQIEPQNHVRQTPSDARAPFDIFWEAYPRKEQKLEARKTFAALKPSFNGHFADVLAGVEVWKLAEQWQEPRYIPLAKKWLLNRQWQDRPARMVGVPAARNGAHVGEQYMPPPVPITVEELGEPPAGFLWQVIGDEKRQLVTGDLECVSCKRTVLRHARDVKHHRCPPSKVKK